VDALRVVSEIWRLVKDSKLPATSSFYNSRVADTDSTSMHGEQSEIPGEYRIVMLVLL